MLSTRILDDRPLNYSPAATASNIPQDTTPPGPVINLTVTASGGGALISFVEPTEDDGIPSAGKVTAYQVRASTDMSVLTDPDGFRGLPVVTPPEPIAPGSVLAFQRRFEELGVPRNQRLFVGVRALDAATNLGMILTAELAATGTLAPALTAIEPPVAIAGREITARGFNFGNVPGIARLTRIVTGTTAEVVPLAITRWEDTMVVVTIPLVARSGTLELVRPDGMGDARFVPVVLRVDDGVSGYYEPPFETIGAAAPDGTVVTALYREDGRFSNFDAAVERIFDVVPENVLFAPAVVDPHSTAVAGTYSPTYDRFLFVASTDLLSMSTTFVTSSTLTPDPQRLPDGVGAGNADRVSVVFLDGGTGGRYPALIAFTINGAIRTATVTDALIQPFNAFFAATSTLAQFDRVTIQRNAVGDVLMAHRALTAGGRNELWLRLNTQGGAPDAFQLIAAPLPPETGPSFEIVSVPNAGSESFVVAYEAMDPDGSTDVRLLPIDNFGQWAGYAPFPDVAGDRHLEDVGLIQREGSVWIALLTSIQTGSSSELSYTEVPFAALDASTPRGSHPGTTLDIAADTTHGRLACKPLPQVNCPIVWTGVDARALFMRR